MPHQGGIEIVGLVDPCLWADKLVLNKVPQEHLQGLPVALVHGEQEKRQHDQNHAERRRGGAQRLLGQKEKRHADHRCRSKTNHLPLGQAEQNLALYPAQVLWDRYIGQSMHLLFHGSIVLEIFYRVENPFVVHPPLKMAGDLGGGGTLIDHHIGVIPQGPQGVHPVEVLLMGAAVVGQYIHPPVPVASDGGMRHKAPEVLRQVLLRVVPGEMHRLGPHLVQQGDVVRVRQPDVQSLGKVHQRPAGGKLFQQRLMVRAGQQVGVQQFDLVLTAPKFREVSDFDAPAPLLAADNAKSAVSRTAPAQKAVGRSQKPRIQKVVRPDVLNLIGEVLATRPIARTALNDLVRIVHHDGVLGVGVREYTALVNQVIAAFGAPPLHPVAPPCMILGELHQAEVGKVVRVHIHQSDLQTATSSMRPEQGLSEAAGLEKREAQEDRVPHTAPNGAGNVVAAQRNALHQHRVDPHADHNEKRLEAQGQQGAEIVLPRVAPLPVHHCGKGDGTYRGHQIHLNHPAVDDQEDTDGEDLRTQPHEDALEPQPQQGANAPIRELGLQVGGHAGYVDARVRNNDAGALAHHILRHIEHRHDDVPGVGDDEHRAEGLEDPLEEDPGVEVMEIVLFNDELDKLIAHDKGEDDAGDGDNDGLREVTDHVEDTAVPRRGRHAHLPGDLAHLGIQGIKHPGQVGYDTVNEQFLEPLLYRVKDQRGSPPLREAPCTGTSRGCYGEPSAQQAGQQRDQGHADEGDTPAGHELCYPQLVGTIQLSGGRRHVKKYIWSF